MKADAQAHGVSAVSRRGRAENFLSVFSDRGFFWIRTAADQTAGIMPWGQVTDPVAPVPLAGKVPAAEACLRAEALALMSGREA